ncbi:hypothetical protein [Flavobacterium chungangense]|uniref:Uncharacterized protein n=1 Tax=Flavobacterium chungangense TaxID=554283 RepID=A0A6V6YT61_9FLAO|nr:hypothetical protein [Flavobacterium chungangense]CAD0002671.1 hypothetical protein FLACHUCJ7_01024 [Flavobacterium chungangense]
MNNEKINDILNDISKSSEYEVQCEEDFLSWEEFQEYLSLIYLMQNHLVIIYKPFANRRIVSLNSKGASIIKKGGWLEYLKAEEEISKQNKEKDKVDFLSKKWIYKTRLLPYFLSLSALILSGLTFYINLNKKSESEELKREVEKMKLEIKALKK